MSYASLRRAAAAVVTTLVALAAVPATVLAHGGNPNFRSVFNGLSTPLPGVRVQVIGYDSLYDLRSTARQTVTIYGYDGEPYSRILPDGTVQQNTNSPAVYLNNDEFGTAPVPAHAHKGAPVVWKTVDKTGSITWHDHRMHYIGTGKPPIVKDVHRKTKIFDYEIPLSEGATKSNITGTLFWVGPAGGGFPVGAGIAFAAILLASAVLVVTVRRRRAAAAAEGAGGERPSAPPTTGGTEAW